LVVATATSSAASLDPGVLPAEQARLASQSLLIDLGQAGARLVAVGERGHVLLSDNKGQTWRQAKSVPTQNLLTGVCFSDERHGIAVGHDEIILTTADGGETWTRKHYAPEAQQPLLDVLCNGQDAIAVGAYSAYFSSSDSGATWSERKFSAEAPERSPNADRSSPARQPQTSAGALPGVPQASNQGAADSDDDITEDFHLNRIVAASGARLYIAAEAGHLYRSDDAGTTWIELPSPYEGSFFGVLPLNGDSLLAYGLRGHLFRSDDAGMTWRPIETHTEAMLNDAVRLTGGGVAAVGLSGAVLTSNDDGEHFTLAQQSDRKGLSAVLADGATDLVAAGEAGVKLIARSPAK
jgi:photosystem II stability/assembly factor-like uncharacterized protein